MLAGLRRNRLFRYWLIGIGLALAGSIVVIAWSLRQVSTATNTNTDDTELHALYRNWYEAAWRKDDGTSSTLVTGTLFAPPLVTALLADTQRSETDQQIFRFVSPLSNRQVGVFVTVDSVTGFSTNEAITRALALSLAGVEDVQLESWKPVVLPPVTTITNGPRLYQQAGVAIFSAPDDIDWSALRTAQLTVTLDGQPVRTLTWSEPMKLFPSAADLAS